MSEAFTRSREEVSRVGEIKGFKVTPFLEAANSLVASDEPERALHLLDNLPGYYRDNPPFEITKLKHEIYKALMGAREYISNPMDDAIDIDRAVVSTNGLVRGYTTLNDIKEANEKGITPHIVDMGPGEFWLPIGLKHLGVKFTYEPIALQKSVETKALAMLDDVVASGASKPNKWFLAYEVIEHLPRETEVLSEYLKHGGDFERVYISTPKYTYGGGCWNWRGGWVPHFRTYTPKELIEIAMKMFREYTWTYYDNEVMLIKGIKNGT